MRVGDHAPIKSTQIVVAAKDLPVGVTLSQRDVTLLDWYSDALPSGAFTKTDGVIGRPLLYSMAAKEPILQRDIGVEGAGIGLAGKIPEGQAEHRLKIFSAWREMVKSAERDYKHKNGRYGDLAALRKAHLLRGLVFESCSSERASRKAKANFVPKTTLIQVTVSEDGQHFDVTIVDDPGHCGPAPAPVYLLEVVRGTVRRDFEDGPEGPIISVAR